MSYEEGVVESPPPKAGGIQFFSPTLLEYVHAHFLLPGGDYDRFRGIATTWLKASAFKRIPGNPLLPHKLASVSAWLSREPLGLDDAEGRRIGLPTLAVGCATGSYKLVEGNHRVHVLIEQLGATRIPVQVVVVEDSWDTPVCEQTRMATEQDAIDLHNKLLDILFEAGHTHCGLWSDKEVWRAALEDIISIRLAKPSESNTPQKRVKL